MIAKLLLFIIVLISLQWVVEPYCTTCVPLGGTCDDNTDHSCSGTAFCNSNNICESTREVGESCSTNHECQSYYCSGTCQYGNYLTTGEKCDFNYQCSPGLNCTGSVCVNPNYPSCGHNEYNCRVGEVCYNKTCTAPLASGSLCNSSSQCMSYQSCIPDSKNVTTCRDLASVPEGGNCASSTNCRLGLYCNLATSNPGYCTPIGPPPSFNCTAGGCYTNQSSVEHSCMCTGSNNQGKCQDSAKNYAQCQTIYTDLFKCVSDNCQFSGNSIVPVSCVEKNCKLSEYYDQCYNFPCGNPYGWVLGTSNGNSLVSNSVIIFIVSIILSVLM